MNKPKLLLQACCGPCATQAISELRKDFDVTIFFWGSNIHPETEYEKRLAALQTVNEKLNGGAEMIVVPYDEKEFLSFLVAKQYSENKKQYEMNLQTTLNFELEKEGGARCALCFEMRLRSAADYAKNHGFNLFASTLTVSPHKNAEVINQIGSNFAKEYGIEYLPTDFKKSGGFSKSAALSKELGIYRQNYCGCKFSKR